MNGKEMSKTNASDLVSWACGENLIGCLDPDTGTLYIDGTGDMENYEQSEDTPWYGVNDAISAVILQDGVTSIGDYAFCDCVSLTKVEIPDSVAIIGECAFMNCEFLRDVKIPSSVSSIRVGAFEGTAYYNNTANWNKGILYLGNWLLYAEDHITFAEIHPGTRGIADCAFHFCEDLTGVSIPSSVAIIGDNAFERCRSLTEVTIPESVSSIGSYAFYDCYNLKSVVILRSYINIGWLAFKTGRQECNLTICGYANSSVNYYAKSHGFAFVPLTAKFLVTEEVTEKVTELLQEEGQEKEVLKYLKCNGFTKMEAVSFMCSVDPEGNIISSYIDAVLVPIIQEELQVEKTGSSSRTVREVCNKLYLNYPRNAVNEAVLRVIGNEYVVN